MQGLPRLLPLKLQGIAPAIMAGLELGVPVILLANINRYLKDDLYCAKSV